MVRNYGRLRQRVGVIGVLALLVLGGTVGGAGAHDAGQTFPQTGQTVRGAFAAYWQQHGGLAQLGYPISGEFGATSDLNGQPYIVQYFERAVFEAHPENAAPYNILLAQLGTLRYRQKYPQGAPGQQAATTGQVFPESGHAVGAQFLAYWRRYGGLAQFGYPISEEFSEVSDLNGQTYTVQYFERAVFERHPENPPPYDVLLAQLGTLQYRARYPAGPPPTVTAPAPTAGPTLPATAPPAPTVAPTLPPAIAPAADPDDWPMYGHDPGRSNNNAAETLLDSDDPPQLAPRWQADLGSNGTPPSGAPIVAGGRVYIGSSVASGPNFFAFDAVTGAPVWSADVGHIEAECSNVGIGATAAIAGNVLVAGGGDGAYYGLDANSGAQLWRVPLDVGPSGFAWESPLIASGRAFLGVSSRCDNPSVRGEVRAVDVQTGAVLGRQFFVPAGQAGAGIWNSPALSPDGADLVVATGEDYGGYNGPYNRVLLTLDPRSLAFRQATPPEGATGGDQDWGTTPAVFKDNQGRTLVAAQHKNGTTYVYNLAALDAGPLWQRPTGLMAGLMPAVDPTGIGRLFLGASNGRILAVDPATGAMRWGPVVVGRTFGNLAIANGLLFVNTGPTGVRVLSERTGALLTTLLPAHAGPSYSGVVVAHGFVYWLSGSYLNAWSLPAP